MASHRWWCAARPSTTERINGYKAAEIIGRHFSLFFTPDDVEEQLPARILRAGHATGRHEAEGWRIRKDGSRFWCNAVLQAIRNEKGQLIGFAKITRDFTERMEAQQALLESKRRFSILVEGVIDYAIYMLDPSGVVTNWNTGGERLKGYTANEIIGHHVVSDIVMAGAMNGIDLAREIRRRQPDLPVVLVTGYSHFALGPEDHFTVLRKPIDLAELSRVTSRAIAEARQAPDGNVVRLHPARHSSVPRSDPQ